MAASQEQKVDYLLKKIGYVSSKTGIAEDSSLSGTKKAPFAEPISSPLVVPSSFVWSDSSFIPTTPPGSTGTYVEVYATASAYQMTVDTTVSGNRTFIARATPGNSSSAIEGDWIDPSFGSSYVIKVYKGDPNSGGALLPAAGSGSNDTWFFDYSSGVLNFNGTSVPSNVTSTNIYLVGYRYIGAKGIKPPAGIATFNDLNVSGVSTLGTVQISSGIVTATSGVVTYYGDGSNLTGLGGESGVASTITVADESSDTTCFPIFSTDATGNINPKTGSNLTFNSSTGALTATSFVKATNSSGFLKADGTEDTSTYLTSYTETQTLDNVVGLGSATTQTITVGTATTGIIIRPNGTLNVSGVSTFQNSVSISGAGNTSTITGPSNLVLDPAAVGDATGTVTILGNLQVDGTQTIINSTTLEVDDKLVSIAKSATNSTQANGAGLEINGASATLTYASTGDKWVFNKAPYYNTNRILTTADEGSGNGIDADTLDSIDSGSFLRSDAADTKTSGDLTFNDDIKINLGSSGQQDSSIYHDGTNATFVSRNGDIILQTIDTGEGGSGDDIIIKAGTGKTSIFAHNNGAVELWNDGSKKFETTGAGVTVTGDLIVSNNARISGILTVGSSSVTIDGTDNTIHGYDTLIAPPKRDTTVTISVTVATKTTAHRYYNTGSTSAYVLNGVESPFLTLTPGRTYKFDQSDNSNSGHPLRFYKDVDKTALYSTGVTNAGTPGNSGAYTQIVVSDTTPTVLHYQCSAHVKMGNSFQTNSEGSSTDASSGTYGDARYTPQITVDASGRITSISSVEIFSTGLGSDLDLNNNDITGTGNINITGNVVASGNVDFDGSIIGNTSSNISGINSVTASTFHGSAANMTGTTGAGGGTYGSSSAIPVITVDGNGRITGISPVAVSGGGGGGGGGSAGVTRTVTSFTATAGQTTFNVNYTAGTIDVFLNGARLNDAEFTATNGTTVVLTTGASVGDIIDVASYSSALGIEIKNNGTLVGTATTINFTTDLNATFSGGTATVASTASGGGGGGGISEALAIAYAVAL